MSSKDEDSLYDEGYFTTSEWLIHGGQPGSQPRPPTYLDPTQRLSWWEGSQDAMENNKDIAKKEDRFESWVIFFVMMLFLLFGVYLLVCCSSVLAKIIGAVLVYFSGSVIYKNQK